MNPNQNNENDEIRIADLFYMVFKHRKLVLMTSIAGFILGVVLSIVSYMRGEMSKQYVVKTSIAVTSQTENGLFTTNSQNPNSSDIHLAEDMVDSVIFVIRSDRTLNEAVDKLELVGISTKDIYNNLKLEQYKTTQIIDISLYWRNAEEGIRILNAINEVAPVILMDVLKIGAVSVVNDPSSRYLIGGSVNASMWLIIMMVGMAGGMGISVLFLFLRPTLINTDDLSKIGITDVLGDVPKDKKCAIKKHLKMEFHDSGNLENPVSDSYAALAHVVRQRLAAMCGHVIYVTSADYKEGKTSVAANLGMKLAEQEKKVLLIDMDVKSPTLGKVFLDEIDYSHSLNAVYQGDISLNGAAVQLNGYMDLLPLLLDRESMFMNTDMLQLLKNKIKEYDYVVIDTVPVGKNADALILNELADAVLMVVGFDKSPLKSLGQAVERLQKSGAKILGGVVNHI